MASDRKDLCRELIARGYVLVRSKNHLIYRNSEGHTVAVPNHNKINRLTYNNILKQIGMK